MCAKVYGRKHKNSLKIISSVEEVCLESSPHLGLEWDMRVQGSDLGRLFDVSIVRKHHPDRWINRSESYLSLMPNYLHWEHTLLDSEYTLQKTYSFCLTLMTLGCHIPLKNWAYKQTCPLTTYTIPLSTIQQWPMFCDEQKIDEVTEARPFHNHILLPQST